MARNVKAKLIVCEAPGIDECRELWDTIVGDEAVSIIADEIRLRVIPAAKAPEAKAVGRRAVREA